MIRRFITLFGSAMLLSAAAAAMPDEAAPTADKAMLNLQAAIEADQADDASN
ncbi:MAG: hypothetical protein AAGI37_09275 [Planctomycetota bacterium]